MQFHLPQDNPGSDSAVDLAIAGGGPAALSAALYAARYGLDHIVLESWQPGGQAAADETRGPGEDNTHGLPRLQFLPVDTVAFVPSAAEGLNYRVDLVVGLKGPGGFHVVILRVAVHVLQQVIQ